MSDMIVGGIGVIVGATLVMGMAFTPSKKVSGLYRFGHFAFSIACYYAGLQMIFGRN